MERKPLLRPGQTEFNRIVSTNEVFQASRAGSHWFIYRSKVFIGKFINGKMTYQLEMGFTINDQIELLHLLVNCIHAELREEKERIIENTTPKRKP